MGAFLRKYGTGTGADIYIPIIKRAVVDFALAADWTPAAGDVKVSKDGGAAANIGTLPTAVTMGNTAMWKFVFADAELQCKVLAITVADSATKAVEDQMLLVETYGHASAMYQPDLSAANLPANMTQILGTAPTEGGAGQLAGGFTKWFNVATPTGTINSIPDAVAGATGGLSIVGSAMTLTSAAVQAIWDALTSALTTIGSIGKLLADNINATISSRSSHSAADVWAAGTRTLTAFDEDATTLDLDATIRAAVGLASANLDTQLDAIPTAAENRAEMDSNSTKLADILTDTAEIGAAGAGLTNINLPDQSMNITGNITGNLSGSVGSVTAAVATTSNIKQNQALATFMFLMTDDTNHEPLTGLTVTCTRSIDGGAFGAGTLANVVEVSNGVYAVDFGSGDLNGKNIILRATAIGADDTFERIVTTP